MGFWERIRDELKKTVEEGWSAVKDGAKIAAEKGEEVAKIGRIRYQQFLLHKKAERRFADLGGMVYDMAKPPYENPLSNPEVMKVIEEIKKIEEESQQLEEEKERIRKKESQEEKPPEEEKQG